MILVAANGKSCEMYPSEYAYVGHGVQNDEKNGANCRNYQAGLQHDVYTQYFIHCSGKQLKLTDSDYGSEQYSSRDYYVWPGGSGNSQLLFIFPTTVNLTSITLHYYSDSTRGLPRLRFWAVPDDFDVWDAPTASYRYADVVAVPLEGNNAGQKNFSVTLTVNTRKILMFKFTSAFSFALSEVQFSNCSGKYINTEPAAHLNSSAVI